MQLPLPKVVADVGPGGPLVTSMGGINSLANDMILRKINQIKAQYAPLTAQAEAASKLAYANLMGPQFLAKLMQNEGALGNLSEDQKKNILNKVYSTGTGLSGGGNVFGGGGGFGAPSAGPGQQLGDSLSNWLSHRLRGVFGEGNGQQTQNPLQSPGTPASGSGQYSAPYSEPVQGGVNPQLGATMAGISHVESGGAKNPYSLVGPDTGKGDRALGKFQVMASNVPEWTKEALGQSLTPEQFLASPEAQEKVAAYMINKHLNKGESPHDVGSVWLTGRTPDKAGNAQDLYGTTPQKYAQKMDEAMQPSGTYAENTGAFKGTVKEGEELGKHRAQAINDIGEQQMALSASGANLDRLVDDINDPKFMALRNDIPFFQDTQLKVLSKLGTPEQQEMIGNFIADAKSFAGATVNSFKGQTMKREFDYADQLKPTENDTMGIVRGKLTALKALKEIAEQKNDVILDLMQNKHMNLGDAVRQANKMIDIRSIDREVRKATEPTITIKNPKTGQKRTVSLSEARKLGVPNV